MKVHPEIFPWFVGVWVILGIANFFFFQFSKDVRLKRKALPFMVYGTGILFLGFIYLMTGDLRTLLIPAPFVLLIGFLNQRMIKFCGSCGKTIYNHMWFSKINFCANCGAKINDDGRNDG